MLDYQLSLSLASLFLCSLIFGRSIVLRRRACAHSALLHEQKLALEKYQEELSRREQSLNREQDFQTSLQKAEVTTGLQKTRISFNQNCHRTRTPERYAYARSMFRSGMQAEEISSALGMSCHEISQLQNLSAIAEKTNEPERQSNGLAF